MPGQVWFAPIAPWGLPPLHHGPLTKLRVAKTRLWLVPRVHGAEPNSQRRAPNCDAGVFFQHLRVLIFDLGRADEGLATHDPAQNKAHHQGE